MDFRKFFMPSPKDFPNSGSFRAPKMMTIIKTMRRSSVGPTGPNKNIKTSYEGVRSNLSCFSINKVTLLMPKSQGEPSWKLGSGLQNFSNLTNFSVSAIILSSRRHISRKMSRKPRIEFPGAFYHVLARGNNKQCPDPDEEI